MTQLTLFKDSKSQEQIACSLLRTVTGLSVEQCEEIVRRIQVGNRKTVDDAGCGRDCKHEYGGDDGIPAVPHVHRPTIAPSAMTDGIDRSMPPPMSTGVMPIAMMASAGDCIRMLTMFRVVKKLGTKMASSKRTATSRNRGR